MRPLRRTLVLGIVATDSTFERTDIDGRPGWSGRCLHCNARLLVTQEGEPLGATIEHVVPRGRGGTDDLRNLALACPGCNHEKGIRHDRKRRPGSRSEEVIRRLAETRLRRWREPPS